MKNREADAVGVITISRGCFERCCSNKSNKKTTPPCSVFKTPFPGVEVLVSVCVLLSLLSSVCSSL